MTQQYKTDKTDSDRCNMQDDKVNKTSTNHIFCTNKINEMTDMK